MAEEKEELFSSKNTAALKDPFMDNNPITIQVLGICSALAVTTLLKPTLVMGIAVMLVICGSNLTISLLRNMIPNRVRMIIEIVVVATLVIIVDQVLKAKAFGVSKELSVFVGLIITNCIVMGRLEAFAMGNKLWPSFLDGIGNGVGYAVIIALVAFFREIFGSGTLMGYPVIPQMVYDLGYINNGLMLLPPGAFVLLGLIVWVQRTVSGYEEQ
jgi:Na+-transporting NADH:ubiquinone oxidoreductase subunit D